ncbi:MAG: hypothetical protein K2K69_01275 [Muribaculaceae bacterium]|nr:hypothetical protein [Muribaculaceae bacterium]
MAKKQVSFGDYEVIVEDGGKIVVMQSGQVLPNAKAGLRAIAEAVGFDFDPKWTTQQGGSKLVKFLASAPAAAAPAESKPQPPPAAKATPAAKNNNKPKDEELTPEEMKQLDEILKRLEALEARIAKLEKARTAASSALAGGNREVITDTKTTSDYIYYKTSEGRILDGGYWFTNYSLESANDLREFKKILIDIDEEDAIDFTGLDADSLKDVKEKNTERYEKFMMQLARLTTKYGSKGVLPALLPNDVALYSNGVFRKTSVSKKNIKF